MSANQKKVESFLYKQSPSARFTLQQFSPKKSNGSIDYTAFSQQLQNQFSDYPRNSNGGSRKRKKTRKQKKTRKRSSHK